MYVLIKESNNYPEIEHEVVKRGYVPHIHQRGEGKKSVKKKRILSLEVTSEEVHDGKMLKKLVDSASKNNHVKCILADGTVRQQ